MDVYDLNPNSEAIKSHTNLFNVNDYDDSGEYKSGLLRRVETKEVGVGTDFNRKLLAPNDWFYS